MVPWAGQLSMIGKLIEGHGRRQSSVNQAVAMAVPERHTPLIPSQQGAAMGMPAARLMDHHVCPMFDGPKPHVGGPISGPCAVTVITNGMPQARVSDMCVCVGPPDVIVRGSATVLVGGLPAARISDMTAHGGFIAAGAPNTLIGG